MWIANDRYCNFCGSDSVSFKEIKIGFFFIVGENENRSVLDAFFLGKALAEVINERIESTVGEVLSTIGKFQAEQQKQVQEIQVLKFSLSVFFFPLSMNH